MNRTQKMHLSTYLKNYGNYTKSKVKELIRLNKVKVNGKIESLSYIVKEEDQIYVDGKKIEKKPYVYYLYHKPIGIVCTNDETVKGNIFKHLHLDFRVFCVGRLDKDTSGLLILTNDGKFANQLIHAKKHVKKEYRVTLEYPITKDFLLKMQEPIFLRGHLTQPIELEVLDETHLKVILEEGKYRQIRRLVSRAQNKVLALQRVRIGKYVLGDLEVDQLKEFQLSEEETK